MRPEVDATEWTCAGDVEKPRVYALRVEAMVARQHSLVLADLEVLGADTAALVVRIVAVSIGIGRCSNTALCRRSPGKRG